MIKPNFVFICFICISMPLSAQADIFKINDGGQNQQQLSQAIAQDSRGLYFSKALDENITSDTHEFIFGQNALGLSLSQKFNFTKNLDHQIKYPFLDGQNVDDLMRSVEGSRLMSWQYSSPVAVDLFKYYNTIAYLRLGLFYAQAQDLEKEFGGPLDILRRQGMYDCLKSSEGLDNLPERMIRCSSQQQYFDALMNSERITGGELDVIQEVFNRINLKDKNIIADIKEIVPHLVLGRNSYQLKGPAKRIGQVYAYYRNDFIETMKGILENYKEGHVVNAEDLAKFSVPSSPLIEQRVRDLAMMEDHQRELLLGQWGSNWAKVKTLERYELALEWFERVRLHPLVKKGFKAIIEQDKEFVLNELGSFKHQMDGYAQYAGFMRSLLDEAEIERLGAIAEIKQTQQHRAAQDNSNWMDHAYE